MTYRPKLLYHNLGGGKFSDVSKASGIQKTFGPYCFSVTTHRLTIEGDCLSPCRGISLPGSSDNIREMTRKQLHFGKRWPTVAPAANSSAPIGQRAHAAGRLSSR
ncbi:MAG TPA: hypothetical protein VK638_26755 [Edaphobacter sp.]|nr:hypothetical protein [Edaphobacter sp.]